MRYNESGWKSILYRSAKLCIKCGYAALSFRAPIACSYISYSSQADWLPLNLVLLMIPMRCQWTTLTTTLTLSQLEKFMAKPKDL